MGVKNPNESDQVNKRYQTSVICRYIKMLLFSHIAVSKVRGCVSV